MSPKFEVIPAKPFHCGQICRRARVQQLEAYARVGAVAHRQVRFFYDTSDFRRAWLIDGELGALFGCTGPWLAPMGHLWLVMSNKGARYPIAFVREARRQLADIMVSKRVLETVVVDGHDEAQRLAAFFGFFAAQAPFPGAAAHSIGGRRRLVRELRSNPDLLVPTGVGMGVAMGYVVEEAGAC